MGISLRIPLGTISLLCGMAASLAAIFMASGPDAQLTELTAAAVVGAVGVVALVAAQVMSVLPGRDPRPRQVIGPDTLPPVTSSRLQASYDQRIAVLAERLEIDGRRLCSSTGTICSHWSFCSGAANKVSEADLRDLSPSQDSPQPFCSSSLSAQTVGDRQITA